MARAGLEVVESLATQLLLCRQALQLFPTDEDSQLNYLEANLTDGALKHGVVSQAAFEALRLRFEGDFIKSERGRFDLQARALKEVLAVHLLSLNSDGVLETLSRLATSSEVRGDSNGAVIYTEKCIRLLRAMGRPLSCDVLFRAAGAHAISDNEFACIGYLLEAAALITSKPRQPIPVPLQSQVFTVLATLFRCLGNPRGALQYYTAQRQILDSCENTDQNTTQRCAVYTNLSLSNMVLGNITAARESLVSALQIASDVCDATLLIQLHQHLGDLELLAQTDFGTAIQHYEIAFKQAEINGDFTARMALLHRLGNAYTDYVFDYDRGSECFEQLLKLSKERSDANMIITSYSLLSQLQFILEKYHESESVALDGIRFGDVSAAYFIRHHWDNSVFKCYHSCFELAQISRIGTVDGIRALGYADGAYARAPMSELCKATQNEEILVEWQHNPSDLDRYIERVRKVATKLHCTILLYAPIEHNKTLNVWVIPAEEPPLIDEETLQRDYLFGVECRTIHLKGLLGLRAWDLATMVGTFRNDCFEYRYNAPGGMDRDSRPFSAEMTMEDWVKKEWHSHESTQGRLPNTPVRCVEDEDLWKQHLSAMYKNLVSPIEKFLPPPNSGQTLCIIPCDELWYIPWTALVGKSRKYFIEEYSIFLSPSIAMLDLLSQRRIQLTHIAKGSKETEDYRTNITESTIMDIGLQYIITALEIAAESLQVVPFLSALLGANNKGVTKGSTPAKVNPLDSLLHSAVLPLERPAKLTDVPQSFVALVIGTSATTPSSYYIDEAKYVGSLLHSPPALGYSVTRELLESRIPTAPVIHFCMDIVVKESMPISAITASTNVACINQDEVSPRIRVSYRASKYLPSNRPSSMLESNGYVDDWIHGFHGEDWKLDKSPFLSNAYIAVCTKVNVARNFGKFTLPRTPNGVHTMQEPREGVAALARDLFSIGIPSLLVTLWAEEASLSEIFVRQFYSDFLDMSAATRHNHTVEAVRRSTLHLMKANYNKPWVWAKWICIGSPI